MKRKERGFVYRFYLFDGESVFMYCLKAQNAKCADDNMQKVIDRDFPEFDIIYRERVSSISNFSGRLDFPVYIDSMGNLWKWAFNELYGGEA